MIINSKGIKKLGLLMIFGGALGNLFDRLFYKAVPDFIDFHVEEFHWFVFNVADIFITIGVIIMILFEVIFNNQKIMNKLKKFILLNFVLLLASCGTMQSAFENQKKNNTDEFLVEKKSPLVMPPDFDELPIPKEIENKKDINENEFKTLITQDNQEIKSNEKDINKNFEELLLDKIKKN
jgi:hypothetical protein